MMSTPPAVGRRSAAGSLVETHARFASSAGTAFRLADRDRSAEVRLRLVAVSPLHVTRYQSSFSLEFTGPATRQLEQAIHSLEHERLGRLDLFLVPIGREDDRIRYEAVFNRLVAPAVDSPSEGRGVE